MSLTQPTPPPAILLLVGAATEAGRTIVRAPQPRPPHIVIITPADVPIAVEPGTRVHVCSKWLRNEEILSRLRVLHHRYGLVDPTGLLGVETSTTQTVAVRAARVITDGVPIGLNLRSNAKQPVKRKPQPTSRYNG